MKQNHATLTATGRRIIIDATPKDNANNCFAGMYTFRRILDDGKPGKIYYNAKPSEIKFDK